MSKDWTVCDLRSDYVHLRGETPSSAYVTLCFTPKKLLSVIVFVHTSTDPFNTTVFFLSPLGRLENAYTGHAHAT